MVDGVHGYTAVVRTTSEPASTAGFTQLDVLVVAVGDVADRNAALGVNLAHFTAGQLDERVVALFGHQLSRDTSRAHELCPLAFTQFDVVDGGTNRHRGERHAVARLDVGLAARDHHRTNGHAVGAQDVTLLTVGVVEQGDARRAVG